MFKFFQQEVSCGCIIQFILHQVFADLVTRVAKFGNLLHYLIV